MRHVTADIGSLTMLNWVYSIALASASPLDVARRPGHRRDTWTESTLRRSLSPAKSKPSLSPQSPSRSPSGGSCSSIYSRPNSGSHHQVRERAPTSIGKGMSQRRKNGPKPDPKGQAHCRTRRQPTPRTTQSGPSVKLAATRSRASTARLLALGAVETDVDLGNGKVKPAVQGQGWAPNCMQTGQLSNAQNTSSQGEKIAYFAG